jgi:regulator of protease activity HflC (stomatin/prohibitin superfamily)
MNANFQRSTLVLTVLLLSVLPACTRIETGEVGLRINFDKTTDPVERLPGSFNQTLVGSIVTFKIQDVAVSVDNMTPLASDNSTIKDFDMTVVYNINPTAVSELWTTKNRTFHGFSDGGDDILLMKNYVALSARNAAYKVARGYESLKMADNRPLIEQQIRDNIIKTLTDEKLGDKIVVSQVQVRAITPADVIVNSANELVRAQNELKNGQEGGRAHRRPQCQRRRHWLHERHGQPQDRRGRGRRQGQHHRGAL